MTNYDRIKNEYDEINVMDLIRAEGNQICIYCVHNKKCGKGCDCDEGVLEWLFCDTEKQIDIEFNDCKVGFLKRLFKKIKLC